MSKAITTAKAEQVLKSVTKAFGPWESTPTLVLDWEAEGVHAICWEEGPYEWAVQYCNLAAGYDAKDEEFGFTWKAIEPVKGVFVEPYYSFVLCIYPE